MSGFLLLQSMAGGTGAGFGTYVAQALRDEYSSSHILNCCIWWVPAWLTVRWLPG